MTSDNNPVPTILCLCREEHHWKLIPGYAAAFRARGINFICVEKDIPADTPLEAILQRCPTRPSWIFHFESAWPLLPQGLVESEIPTVCFQVDTYAYTRNRIRWSLLFDHVAVFHPGYDQVFFRAGHPGAFLLPHAVRREFYEETEAEREFEIGWIGQTRGGFYRKRAEWLPKLVRTFHANDVSRSYTLAETAEVYRRSRIVVNIGRDDFPQDANLRVFEALASGALLITSLPSELTDLGFQEGVHFIGYRREEELLPLVKRYLKSDSERIRIGQTARLKVLNEHTYDNRADCLLKRLGRSGHARLAPARHWPVHRTRFTYLDFYASQGLVGTARSQFQQFASWNIRETIGGAFLLARAWGKGFLSRTRRH